MFIFPLLLFLPILVHAISQGAPVANNRIAPYQVSIRLKTTDSPFGIGFHCSGVLIDRKNVLTSSQCVHDTTTFQLLPVTTFKLVFGSIYRTKEEYQQLTRNVRKVYLHEKQNVTTRSNDLAVLRLDEELPMDREEIKFVELRESPVKGNTECRLTGWGSSVPKGQYQDVLNVVTLKVMGPQNCNASAGMLGRPIDEDHICVGAKGKGACSGDLGAPLVCESNNLTGIVTLETGCGSPGKHAIFTNIFMHKEWIESVVKDERNAAARLTGHLITGWLIVLVIICTR